MEAIKATLRGHGRPDQIIYLGTDRAPFAGKDGWLVNVVDLGRAGYELVDPTGVHSKSSLSVAAKFWGSLPRS